MDDWLYVALAYLVVWGAVALYTWTLHRRIAQARATAEHLRRAAAVDNSSETQQATGEDSPSATQEELACNAPPVS